MKPARFAIALTMFTALLSEAPASAQDSKPMIPTNFGLTAPQPQSELPQSQTPSRTAVRRPKHRAVARLVPVGTASWRLTDGWELAEAAKLVTAEKSLFATDYDTDEWYNAVVPGTVLTSLVEAGVYPDPYYGLNNLAIPESLCRTEWWYRIRFARPEPNQDGRTWLRFEGINYRADVWLNGHELGRIDGAFARDVFDATDFMAADNVLAVKIYPPHNPGIPHEQSKAAGRGPNGGQLCLDGPTFISSEGWDWIPGIRDRNIGIWQEVLLEHTGDITLADPQVVPDLPLPDTSYADLTVRVDVENHADTPKQGMLHGAIVDGPTFVVPFELAAGERRTLVCTPKEIPALHIERPRLWWPNGYGAQELYDIRLIAEVGGRCSDETAARFGIREFSYELSADTQSGETIRVDFDPTNDLSSGAWPFDNFHRRKAAADGTVVPAFAEGVDATRFRRIETDGTAPYLVIRCNGVRIFCRGGNWGMDDGMKRSSRERLEPAFRLHREEGFNMVRNWTGESTEETFYALCDEYGMLVWNDFWLSTEGYNQNVNDEPLFMANARETVRRFRNHPSIAIWCPRNEGYAPPTLEKQLAGLIAREDGTRHYMPNSRYMNLRTSGPWHFLADASEYYTNHAHGFSTELGTPSVPTAETMRKFIPASEQWPVSDTWHYHDLHFGLTEYCNAVDARYGKATSLDDFCRKAQLLNYDSHRAMFEAWNSRMWNSTSGVLLWMSHPAWPSVEWQTYSWDFETHGAFYGCRKACEPLHVQMNPQDSWVVAVNTTRTACTDAKATITAYTLDGKRLGRQTAAVPQIAANGTTPVVRTELAGGEARMVRLELFVGGERRSVNDYLCSPDNDFRQLAALAPATLRARIIGKKHANGETNVRFEVTNTGRTTAIAVKFNLRDPQTGEAVLPAYVSEGYFHLLPGEKRIVEAACASRGEIQLSAEGYNVARTVLTETAF